MTSPRAVLFGPPGAPVREIASQLAALLGVDVHDSDERLAAQAGKPAQDVLIYDGEARYRELESVAVADLLTTDGVVVIGGGAVSNPDTRHALSGLDLVFVDTTITEAARHLGLNLQVPTTVVNPRAQWLRMLAQRRPVYEQVATATVLADGRSADDLAAEVALRLRTPGEPPAAAH